MIISKSKQTLRQYYEHSMVIHSFTLNLLCLVVHSTSDLLFSVLFIIQNMGSRMVDYGLTLHSKVGEAENIYIKHNIAFLLFLLINFKAFVAFPVIHRWHGFCTSYGTVFSLLCAFSITRSPFLELRKY